MALIIPERVTIEIRIEPALLALLKQWADLASDRAEAAALSADVKAQTAALAATIPKE